MIENMRDMSLGESTNNWSATEVKRQYNYANLISTTPAAAIDGNYYWYSYGAYYSWHAVNLAPVAISTKYINYDTATDTATMDGTTVGICPTSWRVPRSAYNGSFQDYGADFAYLNYILNGSYGNVNTTKASNAWRVYPNNFVYSGSLDTGMDAPSSRGVRGFYWSSSASNSTSAYDLHIYGTGVNPATSGGKYNGLALRCVTEPQILLDSTSL